MRSNPPEAKHDGRSDESLADNGNTDGVAAIADLKSWRTANTANTVITAKPPLRSCSGDYRKYALQPSGYQQQARSGDFKGIYRLFSNFFQS